MKLGLGLGCCGAPLRYFLEGLDAGQVGVIQVRLLYVGDTSFDILPELLLAVRRARKGVRCVKGIVGGSRDGKRDESCPRRSEEMELREEKEISCTDET